MAVVEEELGRGKETQTEAEVLLLLLPLAKQPVWMAFKCELYSLSWTLIFYFLPRLTDTQLVTTSLWLGMISKLVVIENQLWPKQNFRRGGEMRRRWGREYKIEMFDPIRAPLLWLQEQFDQKLRKLSTHERELKISWSISLFPPLLHHQPCVMCWINRQTCSFTVCSGHETAKNLSPFLDHLPDERPVSDP